MAEWLIEAGIGEMRAILVEKGRILEIAIEPEGGGPKVGAILSARLMAKADAGGRGRVALPDGAEAMLQPVPRELTEGAALTIEVVREAYVEPGGTAKLAKVRAATGATAKAGPDLLERCRATKLPVRVVVQTGDDPFEAHGWSEALEEAATGIVARPDAMLRIHPTPAMTLIDVDGSGAASALATTGARLSAEAIRRFGITGSIGIDLPTLANRADRLAAADAVDAVLPQPFERTAVNGFGFLQIVRRRERPSLIELIAADPALAAARALLRRAERAQGRGTLTLSAAPAVIARIEARPTWIEELRRRTGATIALRAEPTLSISGGHAQYDHL